jgi:acetyl esterase/lipase
MAHKISNKGAPSNMERPAHRAQARWLLDELEDCMSEYYAATFPKTFITAGNGDPLGPQSVALANELRKRGVEVTALFFASAYRPSLGHEYQFDLQTQAGSLALNRSIHWLNSL